MLISEVTEPTKPAIIDQDVQKKLNVLALADRLGNVAEASRLSGVSRDTIYRHRKLLKQGCTDALKRQETPDLQLKDRASKSLDALVST